jgi:hypothetical protein
MGRFKLTVTKREDERPKGVLQSVPCTAGPHAVYLPSGDVAQDSVLEESLDQVEDVPASRGVADRPEDLL